MSKEGLQKSIQLTKQLKEILVKNQLYNFAGRVRDIERELLLKQEVQSDLDEIVLKYKDTQHWTQVLTELHDIDAKSYYAFMSLFKQTKRTADEEQK